MSGPATNPFSGGRTLVGYSPSVDGAAFTAPATGLYVRPTSFKPNYNAKAEPLATGTDWNDTNYFDDAGDVPLDLELPIYPTANADFLAKCGIGGVRPVYLDIAIVEPDIALQEEGPRQICETMEITAKVSQPVMAKCSMKGTRPTLPGATATIALPAAEQFFTWSNAGAFTLLDGTALTDIDDLTIKIMHNLDAHHGNAGSPFPSDEVPGNRQVEVSFSRLRRDNSQYAKYQDRSFRGSLSFVFTRGGHSITFAFINGLYTTGQKEYAINKRSLEKFTARFESPLGASPYTFTQA